MTSLMLSLFLLVCLLQFSHISFTWSCICDALIDKHLTLLRQRRTSLTASHSLQHGCLRLQAIDRALQEEKRRENKRREIKDIQQKALKELRVGMEQHSERMKKARMEEEAQDQALRLYAVRQDREEAERKLSDLLKAKGSEEEGLLLHRGGRGGGVFLTLHWNKRQRADSPLLILLLPPSQRMDLWEEMQEGKEKERKDRLLNKPPSHPHPLFSLLLLSLHLRLTSKRTRTCSTRLLQVMRRRGRRVLEGGG